MRSPFTAWGPLPTLAANDRANIAIEFALLAPILIILLMNIMDFSRLIWARMEVDNAARMGAQAAFKSCSTGTLPAKTNCSALNTVVTTAAQSTSLGTSVSLASGSPSENYYCVSGTTLTNVGSYSSTPPSNCSAYGNASVSPGDYIEVDVTYSYSPVFSGVTLASAQTLTGKAMERVG